MRLLLILATLAVACASPTEPEAYGPGCTLSVDVILRDKTPGSIDLHYAACPAPAHVTTWTAHYSNGQTQTYRVTWDGR